MERAFQIVVLSGDVLRLFEVVAKIADFVDGEIQGQPGNDASEFFGQVLADGKRGKTY